MNWIGFTWNHKQQKCFTTEIISLSSLCSIWYYFENSFIKNMIKMIMCEFLYRSQYEILMHDLRARERESLMPGTESVGMGATAFVHHRSILVRSLASCQGPATLLCPWRDRELGLDGGWRGRWQFGRLARFRNCERWLASIQHGYRNSCSGSFYKAAAELISVTGDALCFLNCSNGFQQFLWSLANVLPSNSKRGCK